MTLYRMHKLLIVAFYNRKGLWIECDVVRAVRSSGSWRRCVTRYSDARRHHPTAGCRWERYCSGVQHENHWKRADRVCCERDSEVLLRGQNSETLLLQDCRTAARVRCVDRNLLLWRTTGTSASSFLVQCDSHRARPAIAWQSINLFHTAVCTGLTYSAVWNNLRLMHSLFSCSNLSLPESNYTTTRCIFRNRKQNSNTVINSHVKGKIR
jgi:hypothetical protein